MANPLYNILNQFAYEINQKKSTRLKQVVTIKSKDRTNTQKDIEKLFDAIFVTLFRDEI